MFRHILTALVAAQLLVACSGDDGRTGGPGPKGFLTGISQDAGVDAARAIVNAERNPLAAYTKIQDEIGKECWRELYCNYRDMEEIKALKTKLLNDGLKVDPASAYLRIFEPGNKVDPALIEATKVPFLSYAEKLKGADATERKVLSTAGEMLQKGDYVVKDSGRAVTFLAKAWAAGDATSAATIAEVFLSLNDIRNGYLWSLRCTSPCERRTGMALASLESKLTAEAARQAQRLANDATVIEIDEGKP